MGELLRADKPVIQPVYSQAAPSQSIDLGVAATRFTHGGKTYEDRARVTLQFSPDDWLEFVLPTDDKAPLFGLRLVLDEKWDGKLELPDRGVTLHVSCVGAGGSNGGLAFVPNSSPVNVRPPAEAITSAIFHLFNFPDFSGPDDYALVTGEAPQQASRRCGRLVLKADGWVVTIAATERTKELCTALKRQGGYLVTHMGRVEREGGSPFSGVELEVLLIHLHFFLSFALGRWAGVALPIGFDRSGNRVFEQWGLPQAASGSWHAARSWFDDLHGELLSHVFPGFVALWRDELWHKALGEGLYWYLGANERGTGIGVDTGVLLAETALELLAWVYCVQHRKMVSPEAFGQKGLPAADKLRLLASTLDIPLELPPSLRALNATPGRKWVDALDAVTGIRNSIVHPHARRKLPDNSYYEAWKLSLWYIDMVLLRLCGHTGHYANRLAKTWVGQLEPVPWAKTGPQKAGA